LNSIRKWLLAWQISALIVTALIVTLLTYALAWEGFNHTRDLSLQQLAWTLQHHHSGDHSQTNPTQDGYILLNQIWDADGQLIFSSRRDVALPRQPPGLSTLEWEGEEWHVMVVEEAGSVIQVANSAANRYETFKSLGIWLLLPFALLIFILGGLILTAVNQALRPLYQLQKEVRQRSPEHLKELPTAGYPDELQPLLGTLNELLGQLLKSFSAQHRFIADAAHALRTPLTAIRLQAQIANQENDDGARREALDRMQSGIDHSSHLASQLLDMARFDPLLHTTRPLVAVDLVELAKTVIIEHSAIAEQRGVDLGLARCYPVTVFGDPEGLRTMLGNLIDNAIRYGGETIDVAIRIDGTFAVCSVVDNGPGIPEAARERALSAFCRLDNPEIPGSGLGLAIAREITVQHGGTLQLLDAPGGGLAVRIMLPRNKRC